MTATVTKKTFGITQFGRSTAVAYGNLSALWYKLTLGSTGAVSDSDSTAVVGIGDKIRIGVLPGGLTPFDLQGVISDAWTASVTCKIGFEYVDGVDDAAVPQDDAYFVAAGQSLATVALFRKTAKTAPVTLAKDAWLTLTTAGAATDAAGILDLIVIGELSGPK
jgi:hypothetical protein